MFERIKSLFTKSGTPVITSTHRSNPTPLPEFSYENADKIFKNWGAIAVNINSAKMATLPLRLYIKAPTSGQKCIWNTTNPKNVNRRYFNGEFKTQPSLSVLRKVSNFSNDDYLEVIDSHPILTILDQVNSGWNQIDLMNAKIKDLQVFGNAYWYVMKENGQPVGVQPVPAIGMKVRVVGNGYQKEIVGYEFGTGASKVEYDYDEIIHFKRFSESGSVYGIGDLEKSWESLWIDDAEHSYKRAILSNMGRLDAIVSIKDANKVQLDRLRADYNNKFVGASKAGQVGFLNAEVNVQPLSYSDMNLADFDEGNIREVARTFGVPEAMLLGSSPIKANSAQQDLNWLQTTITSLANADEQKLNEQFLPMFGQDIAQNAFLAYDNPVKADAIFVAKKNVDYVNAGIITPNEARKSEGLDPIEGGDELRVNDTSDEPENIEEEVEKEENKQVNVTINNKTVLDIEEE